MATIFPNAFASHKYRNTNLTNITPFTMRDGYTFEELLESVHYYIKNILIPFVNDMDEGLEEILNDFRVEVTGIISDGQIAIDAKIVEAENRLNTVIDSIINESIEVQDVVVGGIVNDKNSDTVKALNTLFYETQRVSLPQYVIDGGVTSIRDYDPFLHLFNERTDEYNLIVRDINRALRGYTRTDIHFYGDSKTQGTGASFSNSLPNKFMNLVAALDGMCYAKHALTGSGPNDTRWTVTGFSHSTDVKRFYLVANPGVFEVTFNASRFSNGLRLWFGGNIPAGTTVKFNNDGPIPLIVTGEITPAGATTPWKYMDLNDPGQRKNHTITVSGTFGSGTFNILGVEHLHTENTLTVSNAGSHGSNIDDWMKPESSVTGLFATTASLRSQLPGNDIAIIQIGTNITADDVANYGLLIDRLKSHARVLIVVPGGTATTGSRGDNKLEMYRVATSRFVPLVDFTDIIGDNVTAQSRGNMFDGIHENESGYNIEASKLRRALI